MARGAARVSRDPTELCPCRCHYGGAVSCPGCRQNHETGACGHCRQD